MIISPQPRQRPLGRGAGLGSGVVAERATGAGGSSGDSGAAASGGGRFDSVSGTRDKLPWKIAGSVGESGLKNGPGARGGSSGVGLSV